VVEFWMIDSQPVTLDSHGRWFVGVPSEGFFREFLIELEETLQRRKTPIKWLAARTMNYKGQVAQFAIWIE
jgi:hypothetical protein